MKSGKQKRLEIKERRRKKAHELSRLNVYSTLSNMPPVGAVPADHEQLQHNNTYGLLPSFYVDKPFVCRDCGAEEVWTAKQQKWWYEIAKGHIDSTAVRCRRCRDIIKDKKTQQKRHMAEMAAKEPHPNEAFFKRRLSER
jgi:hypothetical protein